MNIFLIGYRCSGKTKTGKTIAGILNRQFVDTDLKLVEEEGMTISEIVDKKGWDFFRKKETAVLKNLCNHDKQIVATGGGIVLNKENRVNMKINGTVVWLKANFQTVKKRILKDKKTKDFRPSLTSKELDEEIRETLLLRKPYYEKTMDFSIDTDDLDIEGVCKAVITNLALQKRI
jgi:shikimate kinase